MPLRGTETDVFALTKEDFGVRPIFRISHQTIYRSSPAAPAVIIATNRVHADHYLDAALGVAGRYRRRTRFLHGRDEPRPHRDR